MENLAFSWNKGVAVAGLSITNQDRSSFLVLEYLQLIPEWSALLEKKVKIFSLKIEGISVTVERDQTGKLVAGRFLGHPPQKSTGAALPVVKGLAFPPKEGMGLIHQGLSALFVNAQVTDGFFTFIDRRLNTTTQIKDFSADINMQSLKNPINFFLKGMLALNETPPEPIELKGAALLSSSGKIDFSKAKGTIGMKAGFGHLEGSFDANKFNADSQVTGGHLSCSIDLNKLSNVLAGILGFPPGYSWRGKLTSSLDARGNFQSQIAVNGVTHLTDFSITGGPFQRTSFEQPKIDFSQEVLINPPAQKIEIKVFRLTSDFFKLFLSGTINNLQKEDLYGNLMLSGTGNLQEVVKILKEMSSFPPTLNLSGITQLSFSGTGGLTDLTLKGVLAFKNFAVQHTVLKGRAFREEILQVAPNLIFNFKKDRLTINSLLIRGASLDGEIDGTLDSQWNVDLKSTIALRFVELKKQLAALLPRFFPDQGEASSALTIKGNLKNTLSVTGNHTFPFFLGLKVTHGLRYSAGQDAFSFPAIKAESPYLTFDGQGAITQISKNPFAKCKGKLTFHLGELQKGFRDSFPEKLGTKGKGILVFAGEGNLQSTENKPILSSWNGDGTALLDSISYQGLGTIQNLKSTELTLKNGILHLALGGLLNNGPSTVQGTVDFNQKIPVMKLNGEGKDIIVSRDQKILGYIVPISSNSTQFTGKGNFSLEAAWRGTHWEQEISRSITGKGVVRLREGTLQSQDSLSAILKFLGKPETIQFNQILSPFRLGEEKIYDNTIQVTGKDIQLELKGWTSLVYDPEKKGNPIEYQVTGDSLKKFLGKDAQKILLFLSGEDAFIPVHITGTVQKPKVSIKSPEVKKIFKGFFGPSQRFFN